MMHPGPYREISITHRDGHVTTYDYPSCDGTCCTDRPQRHEPRNPNGNPYITWDALRRAIASARREGREIKGLQ